MKLTMAGDKIFLEANNISRRGDADGRWLLRDVSLRIGSGDRVAIAGPSGAGKTVLLRALAMLDPIDSGQLLWQGEPVSGRRVPEFRRQVMYVQQRPALIEGTVEANLRYPFSLHVHRDRQFDRAAAETLLESLGRGPEFFAAQSNDLSGGEAQIVALLRALQLNPQVLLLDEPTASLDATAAEAVERIIADWLDQRPAERATVWVSHNQDQGRRVSNRLIRVAHATVTEVTP
jgi:putative ABC transport system ATP-binding protein